MSKIPKVGLHIIALLLLTCLGSFGARLAYRWRLSRQPMVYVPDHIDVGRFRWQGEDTLPPIGDAERDRPQAINRVYQLGAQAPIFVSVARVNTLNGLRSPVSYLMDTDGRLFAGEVRLIKPVGENHPHYVMEIAQGHDSTILLMHWVQAPNMPAYVDFNAIPKSVAKSLLLHSTLYSCDVWVPLRTDSNGAFIRTTLMRFANVIEGVIRTGRAPADTNTSNLLPPPSEIPRDGAPSAVPTPATPIPNPGTPSPLSPSSPDSTPASPLSGTGGL